MYVDEEFESFYEDMIKITDRLPTEEEHRRVRHLVLHHPKQRISDVELSKVLPACPHLETAVLTGVQSVSDETLTILADVGINLQGLDISGCKTVTDVGVLEITTKAPPLQWIILNGVEALTDSSISAIAKTCSRLVELEISDLPQLTPVAVRDVWSFSRKLRTLRLADNPLLGNKAFPSPVKDISLSMDTSQDVDKPLPHRPVTRVEELPPLILRHTADNLRVLDLTSCIITDEAVEGVVNHAPRIQTLILSGCARLTDKALEYIAKLGDHLDVLMLAHVSNITDVGVLKVARSCVNLRCIDVAYMSVFELAGLSSLKRLSLVRVHKLTDIALFALAEHTTGLERLHLSYCDRLSLDAIHLLLRNLNGLQHLTATGIPALRRKGIHQFSEPLPRTTDPSQQAAYSVFNGDNVGRLRRFLDKEEKRLREAEVKNILFTKRSDDKMDLY
ncbi:hypothetical protein BJ165DRAFT_1334607 [Panaeolus papilionaceus]|nr:hypothetical protein BJ165DRAFT_1334607 [Panaeolus papilionaceus]